MTTVDKAFAERIKAGNGWLDGDSDNSLGDNPQVTRIVEYTNAWGAQAFGFTSSHEDPDKYLRTSGYIRNPKIWWECAK